jgi:hypothetical protein
VAFDLSATDRSTILSHSVVVYANARDKQARLNQMYHHLSDPDTHLDAGACPDPHRPDFTGRERKRKRKKEDDGELAS